MEKRHIPRSTTEREGRVDDDPDAPAKREHGRALDVIEDRIGEDAEKVRGEGDHGMCLAGPPLSKKFWALEIVVGACLRGAAPSPQP